MCYSQGVLDRPRSLLWPGGSVFLLPRVTTKLHQHHALQLSVALEGSAQLQDAPQGAWETGTAVVIGRDCPHAIESKHPIAMLYVGPQSALGRAIGRGLNGKDHRWLDRRRLASLMRAWRLQRERMSLSVPMARTTFGEVVSALGGREPASLASIDARVRCVLDELRIEHDDRRWTLAQLAKRVGLSERRLTSLFSEELGIPMRQYTLWLRLVRATLALANGRSMTDAAFEAGFADAPHMTRTFQRIFATTPTDFAKLFLGDCQIVQDSEDSIQ